MRKTITIQRILDAHNSIFKKHIELKKNQVGDFKDATIDSTLKISEARILLSSVFPNNSASRIMGRIKFDFITEKERAYRTMELAETKKKNIKTFTWIAGVCFAASVLTALIIL